MATHPDSVRNEIADTVVGPCDNGVLRYRTAAQATIADGAFSPTAFGAAVNGTATANAIGDATNSTGSQQTVADAALRSPTEDRTFFSVTQTGSGGEIELSSVIVPDGERIRTTGLTYTAAS